MKELRAECSLRVLLAFDPRRTAILLIGGRTRRADPDNRWYDVAVSIADDLDDDDLDAPRREGLI